MQPSDHVRVSRALERATLVLNRSWTPVHVTPAWRAVCMVYRDAARVVATDTLAVLDFEQWCALDAPPTDLFLRSPTRRVPVPEVILLTDYDRVPNHEAPFTRRNLFLRDDSTCQYCGKRGSGDRMSIDHVTPRSRGGVTSWDNCVLACVGCNARKGNRTLKEAGLRLLRQPARPRWSPYLALRPGQRLESWHRFTPEGRNRGHGVR